MDWGLVTFYDCSKDLGQPTGMEEMFNLQESEASAVLICFWACAEAPVTQATVTSCKLMTRESKKEDNKVLLPPLKACPLTQTPHCTTSQGHTCGPGLCLRPKLVHTAGGVLLEERSSCSTPYLRHHSHLCLCTALCSCAPNSPQSLWVLREQYSCALLMLKRNQSEPSTHSPLR